MLVSPEILVPRIFLQNLRGTAYVQLNNLPDPTHQKDIDIFQPVTNYNVPKKVAQNKCTCVRS